MYNFVKASVERPAAELDQMLADVNTAALEILNRGGVSAFAAADEWRGETAALVREAIEQEFRLTDPTALFMQRKSLEHGNTYEFTRLVNTFRVVEYAPGADPEIFTPRKGKYPIRTASHQINWGVDLEALFTGQHDIATFVKFAAQALVRHYAETVLTAVNAATTTPFMGDPLRTVAAGADVAKIEIDAALRRMYKYNAGVTIFGTKNALYPLYDIGVTVGGDASKEELLRRGVLGSYRGARLVEINDEYNPYYASFTKVTATKDMNKFLFLSAGNGGGVFLEKDLSMLDWEVVSPRAARWEQGTRFEHGSLIHSPWMYHVVELV
jgi:hypothetical protein